MNKSLHKSRLEWMVGLVALAVAFGTEAAQLPARAVKDAASNARLVEAYGKLPLSFEVNQGRTDNQVRFLSRGPGYSVLDFGPVAVGSSKNLEFSVQNTGEDETADNDEDDDERGRRGRKRPKAASQLKWLGPDNFAGRIRSVLIHPNNANIIYAGAATGGVWKSTNGGQTWASLDDFMPTQVIGSLAMAPADSNTIYAGTGEIFTFFAEGLWLRGQDRGQGIFVSRDAGATWSALASTQSQTDDWRFVSRIAVDPSSSSHIFAATSTGLWQSTDAGQSFTKVLSGIFLDVKIHPLQPRNVVASTMGGPTMFSNDFGANWTASTFPSGTLTADTRVELAPVTQQTQQWRALVIRRAASPPPPTSGVVGLLTSSNGGQSFTSLGIPTGNCAQTNRVYTGALWVDPQNADRMLIASTHVCKTTDGGASFTRIAEPPGVLFTDMHAIVAQPGASDGILVGHDQGLKRVLNYTSAEPTVEDLNNGLRTTQFHSAVSDPVTNNVYGGTQDTGILLRNGATWTRVIHGDGIMASRGDGFFYGGRDQAAVRRVEVDGSNDVCISATGPSPLSESRPDTDQGCGSGPVSPFCAIKTPLLVDPNDSDRLYVGCRQLWRTPSARAGDPASINWNSIKPADGNFVITTMDIPDGNANLLWLGTMLLSSTNPQDVGSNGRLWKSTTATPAFNRMDNGKGLPARPVFDVAIDPQDNQKVYVSYSGFASDNVWKTANGGTSWTNIAAGLPDVPVWSLAVHPTQAGWLYAGTDVGLYTSTDDGVNWSATTRGPSTVAISDLQWKGDTTFLTVATYGRGVHELDARANPERLFPETATLAAGVFPDGHVENLLASDNKRFRVIFPTLPAVSVVLTTRGGFTAAATPAGSDLEFFIEAVANSNASQKLEMFDFLTNSYLVLQITSATAGIEKTTLRRFADGASRFINPTTRELQARITWTKTVSGGLFLVQIDAAGWTITRP